MSSVQLAVLAAELVIVAVVLVVEAGNVVGLSAVVAVIEVVVSLRPRIFMHLLHAGVPSLRP